MSFVAVSRTTHLRLDTIGERSVDEDRAHVDGSKTVLDQDLGDIELDPPIRPHRPQRPAQLILRPLLDEPIDEIPCPFPRSIPILHRPRTWPLCPP